MNLRWESEGEEGEAGLKVQDELVGYSELWETKSSVELGKCLI